MSRSRTASHGVNLLPLLDVLLCTMGTLIIVLGVINREARLHPAKRLSSKAAAIAERNQELADAQEELEIHIRQLSTAREKTLADLENARVRLSGIEEHSRQMEDQLRSVAAAGKMLNASDDQKNYERDALRSQVMQLNARRIELDNELKKARAESADRKPVFAVVPFEGIYQTSRRPIYIECRGDSVILQPEGILFTPTDFMGPGGPGNPLAAALRAAQEYWRNAPSPAPGIPNEPYPLLLVRPNGIIAYYLVREAMSSWDAEFGYELIGANWKLDFPMQPEQQLKEMETHAVAEARDRLQWLAQASPETFARKSKTQYRMSSIRGGVARDGGPSLGNDPFADDPLGGFGKTASGGVNGAGGNMGTGNNAAAPTANVGSHGNSAFGTGGFGNNAVACGTLARGAGNGGLGPYPNANAGSAASGTDGIGFKGAGNGTSGETPGGSGNAPGGGPQLADVGPRYAGTGGDGNFNNRAGAPTNNALRGDQRGAVGGSSSHNEYGGVAWPGGADGSQSGSSQATSQGSTAGSRDLGTTSNGQFAKAGGPSFNDVAGMSGRFGDSGSVGGSSSSGDGPAGGSSSSGQTSSAGGSAGQGGADSSSMSSGTPSPSLNFQSNNQPQKARSLAQNRGRNWALPSGSASSLPLQRPIRIECYPDRLIMLPDNRDQQAEVIPLPQRTDEAVDQLVSAVRAYTKTWGMAGRSMYWKPQLLLEVKPNAESRAADLQSLLADSGLDVKRK